MQNFASPLLGRPPQPCLAYDARAYQGRSSCNATILGHQKRNPIAEVGLPRRQRNLPGCGSDAADLDVSAKRSLVWVAAPLPPDRLLLPPFRSRLAGVAPPLIHIQLKT
jgi:hypothetical protein